MEDRHRQIKQYLQRADVQKRIREEMARARDEATVTISNAARLFGFSENQLRDWDEKGLLRPQRRALDAEQDGKGPRRRQYTQEELSKLAIIHELMGKGKFSIGTIPVYVDELWEEVDHSDELQEHVESVKGSKAEHVHIDQRVERAEKEEFWRYFISQALRLSLLLICEDVPDTVAGAGIILPLAKTNLAEEVGSPYDLHKTGYSLVGWLNQSRSFYTFLDTEPSFEHPSDFRVEPLVNFIDNLLPTQTPLANVLVVVQRKAKSLFLTKEAVITIQRLLGLVYETVTLWEPSFEKGIYDWMYQVTDFVSGTNVSDEVLNGLADIVIQMGGKNESGQNKWRFCCILSPEDMSLPVQQRTLIVRAQSKNAPHNLAAVSAKVAGLSFRAYQSGQIIYRPHITDRDMMIAHREREPFTCSAIAIPISGENSLTLSVMYIASGEMEAFSEDDQRALRIIGQMVGELLATYHARKIETGELTNAIVLPEVVDLSFKNFLSESDFMSDLENLLADIYINGITERLPGKDLSIISVDIDNLAGLAAKYGERVARNVSQAVGLRIQSQPSLPASLEYRRLYHINTDTFYLLLKGVTLADSRGAAKFLQVALANEYRIDARKASLDRNILPNMLLRLNEVTVRLGVHTYTYEKLQNLLSRYPSSIATQTIQSVSKVMADNLDKVLDIGQERGGNVIVSWDPETWGYIFL